MSKESQYKALLSELGVYSPAFDAEIHTLCVLERELSRTMKAWKATVSKNETPAPTDPLYDVICRQRRDILAHRDALGLTPKALQRLRRSQISASEAPAPSSGNAAFAAILDSIASDANAGTP